MNNDTFKIAIIGVGYVGFPLANSFAKYYPVIAYDKCVEHVEMLKSGAKTLEYIGNQRLEENENLRITHDSTEIQNCNVFIVTVPTPVDNHNIPELSLLKAATKMIGGYLKSNDFVVFESTVYPGCTREICIPLLEEFSALKEGIDFFVSFSPERINPGDETNTLSSIIKVVGCDNPDACEIIASLYEKIISAGVHRVSKLEVAEASKIIENTQRDVNIALMNEFSILCKKIGIDTNEVISAASTKWNFSTYYPGLVGGHCIGVDPYYILHKSSQIGFDFSLVDLARKINSTTHFDIFANFLKNMIKRGDNLNKLKTLILGSAYKKNTSDFRNSGVVKLHQLFEQYDMDVNIFDPLLDKKAFLDQTDIKLLGQIDFAEYDVVIFAVMHSIFDDYCLQLKRFTDKGGIIFTIGAHPEYENLL